MKIQNKYRINDSIDWQEEKTNGYIYIYDEKTQNYYKLASVGKDIWNCIVKGMCNNMIVDELLKKYEIDKDAVAEDVKDLIKKLVLKGLVILESF